MAAKVTVLVPGGVEGSKPLSIRLINVTGETAEIGVKNNLPTPVTILKVFFISKEADTTVQGVRENVGIVKSDEELKFTVLVPSTLEPNSLSIRLNFFAETHGVHFTEVITLYNNGN